MASKKKNSAAWKKRQKEVQAQANQAKSERTKFEKALENLTKTGFKYQDNGLLTAYNNAQKIADSYFDKNGNPTGHGYNQYATEVAELFNKVMNQEKFTYDMNKDALFQMYKQQYNKQGTLAMRNAMGVGAARSGGYNSSAAQTAAQTQYLNYMDALNNKAAETYQNALDMYKYKQQNTLNQYNAASQMNNNANEQFWAQANAAANRASNAQSAWQSDQQFQYGMYSDKLSNLNTGLANANTNYNWTNDWLLNYKQYTG